MRDEQPLYYNERYDFYALSRFDDVWDAYHDTTRSARRTASMLETLDEPTAFPSMIFMDPPEHDVLRKLVSRAFTPAARQRARAGDRRARARELLDPFVGTGGLRLRGGLRRAVPPMVIGALLGVPEADRDMVRRWFDDLLHIDEGRHRGQPRPRWMPSATIVGLLRRADRRATGRPAGRPRHRPCSRRRSTTGR